MPDEEIESIIAHFNKRVIPKNEFLIKQKDICNELVFIERSIFRHYHYTAEGKEATACFLLENNFAFEVVSFLTRVPSQEIMQALEDSVVYSINYFTLQQLYLKYPLLERFGRILMEEQFAEFKKVVLAQLRETAEERYLKMIEEQPEIFQTYCVQCGDVAMSRSLWSIRDGSEIRIQAKGTELLRRQPNGSWLFAVDHPFGADEVSM